LETGRLPIDKQIKIDEQYEDHQKKLVYQDLLEATPEEVDRLRKDENYKEKVLSPLSESERQVATYVIEQGKMRPEMRPEDVARAAFIGKGVDSDALHQLTKGMSPEEKEQLKKEYARKYGE